VIVRAPSADAEPAVPPAVAAEVGLAVALSALAVGSVAPAVVLSASAVALSRSAVVLVASRVALSVAVETEAILLAAGLVEPDTGAAFALAVAQVPLAV